jgi:hypothetical protein
MIPCIRALIEPDLPTAGGNIMCNRILALSSTLVLAACASSSADITPTYVSPVMYQSYTCQQLAMEAQGISARAAELSGAQDKQRTNDAIATCVYRKPYLGLLSEESAKVAR